MADSTPTQRNGPSRLTVGALVLLGLLVFSVFVVKAYVRRKVQQKLPQGVTAGEIVLGVEGVTLKGVQVDRDWIRGTLDEVWISRDEKTVRATGGNLIIDLDRKPAGSTQGGDKRAITASKVRVAVTRGGVSATLEGASWDGHEACFTTADVTAPVPSLVKPLKVHIAGGCLDRETQHAWATIAVTGITAIPKVPGLNLTETIATVEGIDIRWGGTSNQWDVKADSFDLGPVKGTKFQYSDDDLGKNLTFGTLTVNHPWIHTGPVTFQHRVQVAMGHWKPGDGLPSGFVALYSSDDPNRSKGVSLNYDVATQTIEGKAQDCQDWMSVIPDPLQRPLPNSWSGTLSFKVTMKPIPKLDLDARCKATCSSVQNLKEPFQYTAYRPDGTTFQRKTGPGTADWLPVGLMGKVPEAVINMEDLAFPYHRGYLTEAFQNSFTDNVAKGKFARGGSTITQQTAKNLWLTREKTLGRKIDELFLAQALESCYSKDEIIGIYLNIIEFGPDVYGIKAGAKHWFGKAPEALDPVEAFWLASILPAPRKTAGPTAAALKDTERLMTSLATQGRIPAQGGDLTGVDLSGWEQNP